MHKVYLKLTVSELRLPCTDCVNVTSSSMWVFIILHTLQQTTITGRHKSLLCGRPIGHIIRVLPIRLSICLSTCLTVCSIQDRNSKTKKNVEKIKIGLNVPHGMSKRSANFQSKRSKVNRRQQPQEIVAYLAYILTHEGAYKARVAPGPTENYS